MKQYTKQNITYSVAFFSSIITILLAFFGSDFTTLIDGYEIVFFMVYVLLNVLIVLKMNQKLEEVTLTISPKVTIDISYNNIFSQEGIIVIPVNEYFDTVVDDKIISSNTLHGKFIQFFFKKNLDCLDKQIEASLSSKEHKIDDTRIDGKNKKYPLGTVAIIKEKKKIFFLVSLTRFNKNHRAQISKIEYQIVLVKLMKFIEEFSQGYKVNVPLLGGGHSGLNLEKQKLLEYLLTSINFEEKLTLKNGLHIVLSDRNKDSVDLNEIKYRYS